MSSGAALLARARRELPALVGVGRARFFPPSEGGAHVVVGVGDLIIKARLTGADVGDEVRALRAAGPLAPALLHPKTPRAAPFLIEERLRGRPFNLDERALVEVAALLARLHTRAAPGLRWLPGGATPKAAVAAGLPVLAALREQGVLTSSIARSVASCLRAHGARIDQALAFGDDHRPRLCHGDVRRANLLATSDGPRLIDFDLAGRGDPAVDLARFWSYERLSDHARFLVACSYDNAGGDAAVVDRAWALWPAMPLVLAISALRHGVASKAPKAQVRARVARIRALSSTKPPLPLPVVDGNPPLIGRIPHLSGSRWGRDDLQLSAQEEATLRGESVVIVEKVDGIAVAFFADDDGEVAVTMKREWRHALDGAVFRMARRWTQAHEQSLQGLLRDSRGRRRVLLGEWLWHRLALRYTSLPSAVLVHGLVVDGVLQSRAVVTPQVQASGLATVIPCFAGVVGERSWASLVPQRSMFGRCRPEGIVVQTQGPGAARYAKWVAPHYVQPRPADITGACNLVRSP